MNCRVGVFPLLFFWPYVLSQVTENNVACINVQRISLNSGCREKRASSVAGKQGNANSLSRAVCVITRFFFFVSVILLNKQYMQIMFCVFKFGKLFLLCTQSILRSQSK